MSERKKIGFDYYYIKKEGLDKEEEKNKNEEKQYM